MILSLIFLAAVIGVAALLLNSKYGSLGSIPQEDLVAYCFWLLLLNLGIMLIWLFQTLFKGGASKKKAIPLKETAAKRGKRKNSAPRGSEKEKKRARREEIPQASGPVTEEKGEDGAPKEWKEEEFE
jgi:hypothetical protein